ALLRAKRRAASAPVMRASRWCLQGVNHCRAPAPSASLPAPKIRWARGRAHEIPAQPHQSRQISCDSVKCFDPQSGTQRRTGSSTSRHSAPPRGSLLARGNPLPRTSALALDVPQVHQRNCMMFLLPLALWDFRLLAALRLKTARKPIGRRTRDCSRDNSCIRRTKRVPARHARCAAPSMEYMVYTDNLFRSWNRQELQRDSVQHGKNTCVHPDSQPDGQNCDHREARILRQRPRPIAQIAPRRLQRDEAPGFPAGLFDAHHISKLPPRCIVRFLAFNAALAVLRFAHRQMKHQLILQVPIQLLPLEKRLHFCPKFHDKFSLLSATCFLSPLHKRRGGHGKHKTKLLLLQLKTDNA